MPAREAWGSGTGTWASTGLWVLAQGRACGSVTSPVCWRDSSSRCPGLAAAFLLGPPGSGQLTHHLHLCPLAALPPWQRIKAEKAEITRFFQKPKTPQAPKVSGRREAAVCVTGSSVTLLQGHRIPLPGLGSAHSSASPTFPGPPASSSSG